MVGTILGNRYQLTEKIGEGGMAVVYKAKCLLLNRYVAVKILKDEYSGNEEFMDKFRKEATAAASVSANNIVNIYDVGCENNINYIVMELVNGRTLKDIIRQNGRLSVSDTLGIGVQIAKALEIAHKNNIIHRDIKPQNILVTDDGVVKVTDFGIAKAVSADTLTHTSRVIGSAHYFSPEQAKGKVVDYRTDIYSLGIVLYEMITGKVPFDGDSAVSVALKHIQDNVISPKAIINNIPDSLNSLIMKAIEKEPSRRYQTATDILMDLKRIQSNSDYVVKSEPIEDEFTRVMDIPPYKKKRDDYDDDDYDDSEYDDYDDDDDDYDDDIRHKKKKNESKNADKKKYIILGSVAVVLVVVLGVLAGKLLGGGLFKSSSSEVKVPIIIGKTTTVAQKEVEDAGLKFVIAEEVESDKPKDTVVSVNPREGTSVQKNSEVKVMVSKGNGEIEVPDIIKLDKKSAEAYIINVGLQVGEVREESSETISEGCVISSDPKVGYKVERGSKVNIVISKGPAEKITIVPNITNISISQAQQILEVSNLKLGDTTPIVTSEKDKDGKIINQDLAPSTKVKEGSKVNVTYYKYEDPDANKIAVPNFVGMSMEKAKNAAAAAGIRIAFTGDSSGNVVEQNPSAGTKVDKNAIITLILKSDGSSEGGASGGTNSEGGSINSNGPNNGAR